MAKKPLKVNIIYTDQTLKNKYGGLKYTRKGDACFDLRACFGLELAGAHKSVDHQGGETPVQRTIWPGTCCQVSAGFKIEVPPGYMACAYPRGGMGTKGVVLGNLTGIIDVGYQGDVFLNLWNRTGEPITIDAYDRVAQMALVPVAEAEFNEVDAFSAITERGDGCLNSSGHK